jgi:hypothetical protein
VADVDLGCGLLVVVRGLSTGDLAADLLAAFPQAQREDASAAVVRIPTARLAPAGSFDEAPVSIPYRIHNDEPAAHAYQVVDWDAPMLAPRERDLMFVVGPIIGGLGGTAGQQKLFWRAGHGLPPHQRVVEDIAAFARSVLSRDDPGEETKAAELAWFGPQFAPGSPADLARRAEHHLTTHR